MENVSWENVSWENVTLTNVTLRDPLFPTLKNWMMWNGKMWLWTALVTFVLLMCTISFFLMFFSYCCCSCCVQGQNVLECMNCSSSVDALEVVDNVIKPEVKKSLLILYTLCTINYQKILFQFFVTFYWHFWFGSHFGKLSTK